MKRQFYVGYNYFGINYAIEHNSYWRVFMFASKKERDEYVRKHEFNQNTSKYVCQAITKKDVIKILGKETDYLKYQIVDQNELVRI